MARPPVDHDAIPPAPPSPGPVEGVKERRHRRLLRSIQRISSSPSLLQARPRASSAPYGNGPGMSLSCASLTASSPTGVDLSHNPSSSGYFTSISLASIPGSPMTEFPAFEGIESRMANRGDRVDRHLRGDRGDGGHEPDPALCPALRPALRPASGSGSGCGSVPLPAALTTRSGAGRPRPFNFWGTMPDEIRVHILSYLQPKELARASRVSKDFHNFCFDGQLWERFDATDFYQDISAEALANIIIATGPFIKDLNLRGCVQVEHYKRAEAVVIACRNLVTVTLEGCRNLQRSTLYGLIKANEKLRNLNLTGLPAVTNSTCKIISQHCPQLESFNVSWCKQMDARGIRMLLLACPKLIDLRAGEVRGFDNLDVAETIFRTNKLERLVLNGCVDINDQVLQTMVHGIDPEIDVLTERPIVPARTLKHLDLGRCRQLGDRGIQALAHLMPQLEGLQLNGCTALTDAALEPIVATAPQLTHLDLEDVAEVSNDFLCNHLAKAPCAAKLEHLSVSYCEKIGDAGMIAVMRNCVSLRSVDMDNTRIGDLVLAEAAAMVRRRAVRTWCCESRPRVGLQLVVYDCSLVTWTGVREVLSWNAEVRNPSESAASYPTEVIALKCYHGWRQTVEQHMIRVLRGDFAAAGRLERKWGDYQQALEEAGTAGAGLRRRRRRAREAQLLHADEEEGGAGAGAGAGVGRRRARTASSCSVM